MADERAIFAGFGGQGIKSLGQIFAEAMVLHGWNVTFISSYGAEVRGGISYCHVRVSDEEIYSPIIERATTLILMDQRSAERFRDSLDDEGVALVNSSLVELPGAFSNGRHMLIPATDTASELGDLRAANMVMLGAYDEMRTLDLESQLDACFEKIFPGKKASFRELNLRAIEAGREFYRTHASA